MVAREYFEKEIARHATHSSEVVVIVHDSCYGHRFSRPRTTKAALNTIVERPERILATLLGASTAYVRLGGHHVESRYPPQPDREPPKESIPFQIRRTTRDVPLNHAAVTAVHGAKWMEELQIMCDSAESKLTMNGKELSRPIGYGKDETGKLLPKLHEGDLYLCSETLAALQGCIGGVCDAVDVIFADNRTKRAFVCIRPPGHHCSADFPSGFCWLNNVHIGITYAAMTHGLTHAAIIDFDLHHGDGSQMVTWDHNSRAKDLPKNAAAHKKTPIGYYSLHDINSYPCEWGDDEKVRNASLCIDNAHRQSIWNVHLEPWNDLADFWRIYESKYMILLEKTRKFLKHHSDQCKMHGIKPKAAIFLSAGFDASEWEGGGMQRHGVNVPTEFYARFTSDVVKLSQEADLGVDGRVISVLEGGYSDRALTSGVLSHIAGLVDDPMRNAPVHETPGLGTSMAWQPDTTRTVTTKQASILRRDPDWWNVASLEQIEAIVAGHSPALPRDKSDKAPGNYSSPTHASSAKMTETARERRSLNAQIQARLSLADRPPPPLPDVDWAVAAYELSRLIIPSDRQTVSCRPDELNAEATRARKERQSGVGVATIAAGEPMQLRERKAKAPPLPKSASRSSSRTRTETRRTTIASFNDLPDPTLPEPPLPTGVSSRPRRRSSAASSIVSGFSEMKLNSDPMTGAELRASDPTGLNGGSGKSTAAARPSKPLVPKKPRATAAKTIVPAKPALKKVAGSRSTLSRQSSNASEKRLPHQQASSDQPSTNSARSDPSGGMDELTNGMKKVSIKLKMPQTKATTDATQVQPEHVKKSGKAPRKPAVPRTAKSTDVVPVVEDSHANAVGATPEVPSQSTINPADALSTRTPTVEVDQSPVTGDDQSHIILAEGQAQDSMLEVTTSFSKQEHLTDIVPKLQMKDDNLAGDVLRQQNEAMVMPPPPSPSKALQHAHPEVVPDAGIHSQYGPPASRPSSSGRSSRPMTPHKHQLPKFTSTSPIPFASSAVTTPKAGEGPQKHEAGSTWDVPDTPR